MIKNKAKFIVIILISVGALWTSSAQNLSILQIFNTGNRSLSEGLSEGNIEKIEQSLVFFHRGLEINPNYFEVLKSLSIAYYMLGNLKLTRQYVSQGLIQNSSDINLVLLDIFLDLTDDKLQSAKAKLAVVRGQYPFKIEIVYLDIMYAALFNDQQQLDSLVLQMQRKFGIENEYFYIYAILLSMQRGDTSFKEESYVNKLLNIYPNQPWIQWMLADYFRLFGDMEKEKEMIDKLKNSRIISLTQYYYENTFLDRFKQADFNRAIDIASEYSEKMPLEINAWKFLAIAYNKAGRYRYAERAFSRAIKLAPDDAFLMFMYDTLLSTLGNNLEVSRNERTDVLMKETQYAFDSGNINSAKELIDTILYINPLLLYPRRMQVRIYEQEGNFYRAQLELENIIKRGYEEENIDELLVYYKNKVDEFSSYEIDEKLYLQEKIWKMGFILNDFTEDTFERILYHDFLYQILFTQFSDSYDIDWVHESNLDTADIDYQLEIQFLDRQENTVVTIVVRNAHTEAQVFSFNKIYTKDFDIASIAKDLGTMRNTIVPHIVKVVLYDKIQTDIILNTSNVFNIEKDQFYTLYANKDIYNINLVKEDNHFALDTSPPRGVVQVKEVGPRFSIATIEKNESMSNSEYLNLFQNIQKGDFIVITPLEWTGIQSEEVIVENLQRITKESIMGYYFKNLYITNLFFDK